jgi:hypothetical protein
MTLLATLALMTQVITPTIESGWASQYASGVMERVIENRQNGC